MEAMQKTPLRPELQGVKYIAEKTFEELVECMSSMEKMLKHVVKKMPEAEWFLSSSVTFRQHIEKKTQCQSQSVIEKLQLGCAEEDADLIIQCFCLIDPRRYDPASDLYENWTTVPPAHVLSQYFKHKKESTENEVIHWLIAACIIDGKRTNKHALDMSEHQDCCWKIIRKKPLLLKKIYSCTDSVLEIGKLAKRCNGLRRSSRPVKLCEHFHYNFHIMCSLFPPIEKWHENADDEGVVHITEENSNEFMLMMNYLISGNICIDKNNWHVFLCLSGKYQVHSLAKLVFSWLMENVNDIPLGRYQNIVESIIGVLKEYRNVPINKILQSTIDLLLSIAIIHFTKYELEKTAAEFTVQGKQLKNLLQSCGICLEEFNVIPLRERKLVPSVERIFSITTLGTLGKYAPKLKSLHLNDCTDIDNEAVEFIDKNFSDLRALSLQGCGIKKLKKTGKISQLSRLEEFDLSQNRLSTSSISRLTSSMCNNITKLDLSRTDMSDSGLHGFINNRASNHLISLRLAHCSSLTESSLLRIGRFSELEELDLAYCQATNEVLRAVARIAALKNLTIKGCLKIDTEAISPLAKHSNLQYLDISETRANESTIYDIANGCISIKTIVAKGCSTTKLESLHLTWYCLRAEKEHAPELITDRIPPYVLQIQKNIARLIERS
ncbi:MAG: hypothetical protein H7A37_05265 [Chlamydiales bacterium]|nr:hypothetical protein [Chlamydiales bacterium]